MHEPILDDFKKEVPKNIYPVGHRTFAEVCLGLLSMVILIIVVLFLVTLVSGWGSPFVDILYWWSIEIGIVLILISPLLTIIALEWLWLRRDFGTAFLLLLNLSFNLLFLGVILDGDLARSIITLGGTLPAKTGVIGVFLVLLIDFFFIVVQKYRAYQYRYGR